MLAGVGLRVGEVAGYRRSLEYRPFEAKWFYGVYVACVVGAAALVWFVPDLVWLNIAAQVLNAFLLPLVIGFLVALAVKAAAGAAPVCGDSVVCKKVLQKKEVMVRGWITKPQPRIEP